MKKLVLTLGIIVCATHSQALAQGMFEYGRSLEGAGNRQGSVGKPTMVSPRGSKPSSRTSSIALPEGATIPSTVTVKQNDTSLFRQHATSEIISKLQAGESLNVMAEEKTGGELWYLVSKEQGSSGWVKASEVEAIPVKKQARK